MVNKELLDDYAANRMTDEQRANFEEQLATDPAALAEAALQKKISEGIRQARATELKARLQRVPVNAPVVSWQKIQVWRIAAAVGSIGVLVAASLYYAQTGREIPADTLTTEIGKKIPLLTPAPRRAEQPQTEQAQEGLGAQKDKTTSEKKEAVNASPSPSLSVIDPTQDMAEQPGAEEPSGEKINSGTPARADVAVLVYRNEQQFDFHYQFDAAGLRLYGPFNQNLFEVIEISGEPRSFFLFYQSTFYRLHQNQKAITRLEPVTSPQLLRLLRDYRAQ